MTGWHRWIETDAPRLPLGKVVCVGRNYAAHARELGNVTTDRPLLFMKPATAIVDFEQRIQWPHDEGICHYETELSLLIGATLSQATVAAVRTAVVGVGVGLDLSLRDLQDTLKKAGHPWERAKAFDGAAPLSPFIPVSRISPWSNLSFSLNINGERRQTGDTRLMLFSIETLLMEISRCFRLEPGDVVLTGTPEGVGALETGLKLDLQLEEYRFTAHT